MWHKDGWVCISLFINSHCQQCPTESSLCHGLDTPTPCCPSPCWASSEIPLCAGEGGDAPARDTGTAPSTQPWADSPPPAGLPSCCSCCCCCCCWSPSDTLSELSQAWIIGSWNQPKHEPADEGWCLSLNCPLTVKKSICGGALLTSRQEHWPMEPLTVLREHQFLSQTGFMRLFLPQTAPEAAQRQTGNSRWGRAQHYILACHKLKKKTRTTNPCKKPLTSLYLGTFFFLDIHIPDIFREYREALICAYGITSTLMSVIYLLCGEISYTEHV